MDARQDRVIEGGNKGEGRRRRRPGRRRRRRSRDEAQTQAQSQAQFRDQVEDQASDGEGAEVGRGAGAAAESEAGARVEAEVQVEAGAPGEAESLPETEPQVRAKARKSLQTRTKPRSKGGKRSRSDADTGDELVVSETCSFAELALDERLKRALDDRGYKTATPIQAGAIPVALEGKDVLGQAQTGSGKTAAYGLVVLHRVLKDGGEGNGVKAIVITPTRELAFQVTEEIARLARHTPIRLLAVVGGQDIEIQIAAIRDRVDVLVGTPGRILDLMYRGELDLGQVLIGVVDEADEMLNMGFVDDVEMILSCLPPERQTLMFSATIPPRIRKLADGFMRDRVHVRVENTEATLPDIDQRYVVVSPGERFDVLRRALEGVRGKKSIVFCRTKARARQVASRLGGSVEGLGVLEGDMDQAERNRVMRRFRRGEVKVLVATDVAARGIDVKDVALVVNFDCPDDVDAYVHRVGRTARAGRSGAALTFVEPKEMKLLRAIERRVGALKQFEDAAASKKDAPAS